MMPAAACVAAPCVPAALPGKRASAGTRARTPASTNATSSHHHHHHPALANRRAARFPSHACHAHIGDADWIAQQAGAAAVILGGFVVTGGLEDLGIAPGRGSDDRNEDLEDPNEPCSMCEGTGRTECSCTRWSDDGEGCSSCGYTGVRVCPACRGGGRAVRVTLEIPVEPDPEPGRMRDDRTGFEEFELTRASTRAQIAPLAFSAAAVARRPIGNERDAAEGRVWGGVDDDWELEGDDLARLLGSQLDALSLSAIAEPPRNSSTDGEGDGSFSSGNGSGDDPSGSKDDEFYAQSGEAIRTLREDYPQLLEKSLTWGIYREDIGLIDETQSFGRNPGHVVASGIKEYKRCQKWLRTAASILFSHSEVQVQRIWSPLGTSGTRTIKVRWSIIGKLRLVGSITEEAHVDGISEYKLDNRGFIYQHTFTDLDWDVAQLRERVAALSNVLGQRSRVPELGSGQWFRNLVPEGWFKST
mmetsp:Transcript_9583/g.22772  ORF Transcript_9583/g.22772 Transcript_9583/m.22772 type:complete len:473 (-) Transcript_9583:78-1496(-)